MTGLFFPIRGCQQAGDKADAAGSPNIRYWTARSHTQQDPQLPCRSQRQWVGGAAAALDPETGAEGHRPHHTLHKMKSRPTHCLFFCLYDKWPCPGFCSAMRVRHKGLWPWWTSRWPGTGASRLSESAPGKCVHTDYQRCLLYLKATLLGSCS